MKTRIYLKEWFYNAGIIGFLRILKHNEDEFATIKQNYIEFETENLRNFHKYYFQYFFDIYNVAERTKQRIEKSFNKISNYIEKEPQDKTEEKQIQERIKNEKKYIKLIIKTQLDKIKKVDEKIHQEMSEAYSKIDSIKTKEDIENLKEIQNILNKGMETEIINKRLTMNLFKSILSKNYFGQPSFLNVVKSALTFKEQQEIMYKDYISNIVETGFLQEIAEGRYTIQEIKNILEEKQSDEKITKEISKIYVNIQKKYIEKEKTIEEIQQYIKNQVFSNCYMCESENAITSSYSESNFVPLAISSDNMKNFFWNQNAKLPVCDLCKLILFCVPAGITSISKIVKENKLGKMEYKEKEILSFVNYDTDTNMLLKVNNNFKETSRLDKSTSNPYGDLILNIVTQEKQVSEWQLQNIFVVEFETEYLAYSRMEYFNIKRHIAKFFKQYSNSTLNLIKDYKYKLEIIDYILKNKDIKYIINERLRENLKEENPYSYNSYLATKIRLDINLLKKEENGVEEKIKKNNAKLNVLYNLGTEIHEELKRNNEANKLNGYTYKLLNCIKVGNRKEFMDIIIRIHMSMGKNVSPIFLEVMQDSDLDWEDIGNSFLAGLISDKYEKKEEVNENE